MLSERHKRFMEMLTDKKPETEAEIKDYNEYEEISEDPVIEPTHEVEPHKHYEWDA